MNVGSSFLLFLVCSQSAGRIHRMIKLGLSIDDDGAEDDDLPPLEADVPGQDEGSRMEVSCFSVIFY